MKIEAAIVKGLGTVQFKSRRRVELLDSFVFICEYSLVASIALETTILVYIAWWCVVISLNSDFRIYSTDGSAEKDGYICMFRWNGSCKLVAQT